MKTFDNSTLARYDKAAIWVLIFTSIYLVPLRTMVSGDTLASIFAATSIADGLKGYLDTYPIRDMSGNIAYYWVVKTAGEHYVSGFGIGMPVLMAPFFWLSKLLLGGISFTSAILTGKLVAALMVAFSAVIVRDIAKQITSERISLCIMLIYALATGAYGIASQEPWQHSGNQLFYSLTMWLLIRWPDKTWTLILSGLLAGFSIFIRASGAIPMSLFFIVLLLHYNKRAWLFASTMMIVLTLQLLNNYLWFSSPFIFGQSIIGESTLKNWSPDSSLWTLNIFPGLLGLLFSPSRGVFTYSPILLMLFSYLKWVKQKTKTKEEDTRTPTRLMALRLSWAIILGVLAVGTSRTEWWGGFSWGPRYLADAAPFLAICLVPIMEGVKTRLYKTVVIMLFVLSFAIQFLGSVSDIYGTNSWNSRCLTTAENNSSAFWQINPPPQIIHHLVNFTPETNLSLTAD